MVLTSEEFGSWPDQTQGRGSLEGEKTDLSISCRKASADML